MRAELLGTRVVGPRGRRRGRAAPARAGARRPAARRTASSWSPARTPRSPPWSAGSWPRPSSACRPAPATAPRSAGMTALLLDARLVRGRASRSSTSTTASAPARSRRGSRARRRRRVTRVLYLDCVAGVAGDMLLGALLDAGADPQRDRRRAGRARRRRARAAHGAGEPARDQRARTPRSTAAPGQPHRDWRSIRALIDAAGLPERARDRAQEAFRRLADAEARIHGVDPEQVHFHEVGAVDAIGEVCGVALALEDLRIDARRLLAAAGRRAASSRPPTGGCRCRRPRRWRCSRARRSTASTSRRSSSRRPAPRSSPRSPTATGRCPRLTLETVGYGAGTRDIAELPERRAGDRRRRDRRPPRGRSR